MENPPATPEDTQPASNGASVRPKRTRVRTKPALSSLTQEIPPVTPESTVAAEVVTAPRAAIAVAESDPAIDEPLQVEAHSLLDAYDASVPRLRFVSITFLAGFGIGAFIGVALALLALFVVSSRADGEPTSA